MEEIFNQLEQFGLKYVENKNFELNHKYIILGTDKYFSDEDKEINFSNKLKSIIEKTNKPIKGKKTFKKSSKKSSKNGNIYIFNYAKHLGVYKGLQKVYCKNLNIDIDVNVNHDDNFNDEKKKQYDSESESDSDTDTSYVSKKNRNYCEYDISGYVFEKNNEYNILKFNDNSLLFEVDVSFDDSKFLDTIIMVCSNIEDEKNKIIQAICVNKEITLKLYYNEFPKKYKKFLNFDKEKQYAVDENFVFFK